MIAMLWDMIVFLFLLGVLCGMLSLVFGGNKE